MALDTIEAPKFERKVIRPYRVREGMFAWMAHRLSGLALVGYLVVHIWGLKALSDRDAYNALIASYHGWIFKVGEFLLWAAVVYHMINGLRIVLIDFLGWSPHQKRLFWTLGAVAVLMIIAGGYPSIYALIQHFG
jgi:succinate dehydrogenase / fumarate reductase cytochrome b subunit